MSEENLNLDDREEDDIFADDTDTSNESEGEGTDDNSNVALSEYNKRTGKSFKSWDDVVKSTKEADKLFSQGKHKETAKASKTEVNEDLVEMFFITNPEADLVKDKLESFAKIHGSVIKAWRNEPMLKEMAQTIARERKEQEELKSKVEKPSIGSSGSSKKLDFEKIKPEEVEKLTPTQKIEWVKLQASKEID